MLSILSEEQRPGFVLYEVENYLVEIGEETPIHKRTYWIRNVITGNVEAKVEALPLAITAAIHYNDTLIKLYESLSAEHAAHSSINDSNKLDS